MTNYFSRLWKYIKPYWLPTFLAPLLMMGEVIISLYQPALMQRMIDIGVANSDLAYVTQTAILMLGLSLGGFVFGYGCSVLSHYASLKFGRDLRQAVFTKVQTLSFGNIDKLETGSIITRLTNDVTQVQDTLGMLLRMMVRAPLMLIGSIFMAVITAPSLSWIIFVITPILMFIIFYLIRKSFPIYTVLQEKIDRVNTVLQENLAGMRVVKAFVRSDHEKNRFGKANEDLTSVTILGARLMNSIMPLMMLVINLGIVAVLWFGGKGIFADTIAVGQILAFINYLSRLLFSLMMVNMVLTRFSRAGASTKRLFEVLETEPDIQNKANPQVLDPMVGEVTFNNVSFNYADSTADPVLKNINFTAQPGETIAIMGATGSGKSTLVQLIPRLYEATKGSVRIDGVDVRDIDMTALRKSIGMVLQQSTLFSGTIMDNIRYGRPDATIDEVIEVAKAAQAHDFIMDMPEGYQTNVEQRGVNFSGGQKQRISIARALMLDPKIMILDDSTSAVDVMTESNIRDAIKRLQQNATSFIIAQRVSTVLTADRIMILEDGEIVAIGNHAELLGDSPIYRDIYRSQLGEEGIVNE